LSMLLFQAYEEQVGGRIQNAERILLVRAETLQRLERLNSEMPRTRRAVQMANSSQV
jgi:hypothetical protein